ncbi:MAG TPA: hypothetical protein VGK37_01195 [Casimicrobiaceae bacterium]|jgi:hypothetical protein
MSIASDNFAPYAQAEKELCDKAGPLLSGILKEVEERNGITIREIRVTFEKPAPTNLWSGANCVIVR